MKYYLFLYPWTTNKKVQLYPKQIQSKINNNNGAPVRDMNLTQRGLFLSEVNNRETLAATEATVIRIVLSKDATRVCLH